MLQAIWKAKGPLKGPLDINMQLVIASFKGATVHVTVDVRYKTLSLRDVTL